MTDRRIDRSVAADIAALNARVRAIETLIGGGRQEAFAEDFILDIENYSSTSYGDLPLGPGPEVTVKVGPVGKILVIWSAMIFAQGTFMGSRVSLDVIDSGGSVVVAATDDHALAFESTHEGHNLILSRARIVSGLSAGDHTARMKYRVTVAQAGYGFGYRSLQAAPF